MVFRGPTEVSFVMRHNSIWLLFHICCFQQVSSYVLTTSHENWGKGSGVLTAVEQSGPWTQSGQIWYLDHCPQPFLGCTGKNGSCWRVLPAPDFTIVHYLAGAGGVQAPVYWFLNSTASSDSSLQPPTVKTCQKSSYPLPRTKCAPLRRSRYQYFIIIILS